MTPILVLMFIADVLLASIVGILVYAVLRLRGIDFKYASPVLADILHRLKRPVEKKV